MAGAGEEARTIWRHGRVYGLGKILNRVAGLLLIPILLRVLSPEDWGAYTLILLSGQFLTIVPGCVTDSLGRVFFDFDDETGRSRVMATTLLLFAAMAGVLILLSYPLAVGLGALLFGHQDYLLPLLIACGGMVFEVLFTIELQYLRLRMRSLLFIAFSFLRAVGQIGLSLFLVIALDLSVIGIVLGQVVSVACASLVLLAIIWREVGGAAASGPESRQVARELIRLSLPLVPAWLARNSFPLVERGLLNALANTAVVGLFSVGSKLAEQLKVAVTDPFETVWGVRLLERGDSTALAEEFHRVYAYFMLIATAAALALSLFGPEIIHLIAGADFREAWRVLPLLALGQVVLSVNYHFETCLLQRKRVGYLPLTNGVALAVCVAALLLLIPPFGMLGAAAGIVLAQLVRLGVSVVCVRRCSHYAQLFPWASTTMILATACLAYAASAALFGGAVGVTEALVKLLIFVAFLAAAFLGPALSAEERRQALSLVRARFARTATRA